jgi:hypothetical protein
VGTEQSRAEHQEDLLSLNFSKNTVGLEGSFFFFSYLPFYTGGSILPVATQERGKRVGESERVREERERERERKRP